jgi:hypothetical protein
MAEEPYSKNILASRIGLAVYAAWGIGQKILARLAPARRKDGAIKQDHFGKFVYNTP